MTQNRKGQTRPGDATGQQKAADQRQYADQIAESARGMTLINAPVVERVDEVVDYSQGGSPAVGNEAGVRVLDMSDLGPDTEVSMDDMPDDDVDASALPDGTTDVRPEMVKQLDEPQAKHDAGPRQVKDVIRTGDAAQQPRVEAAFKVMRVNTDLEDVTIGKDNHFTFREGTRYRVTPEVYNHLDEKGYIWH